MMTTGSRPICDWWKKVDRTRIKRFADRKNGTIEIEMSNKVNCGKRNWVEDSGTYKSVSFSSKLSFYVKLDLSSLNHWSSIEIEWQMDYDLQVSTKHIDVKTL